VSPGVRERAGGELPDCFVGAWRRVSLALGEAPACEPSDVLWLQARAAFADVRLPRARGAEPAAFAGTTTWEPPVLTWHHRLDLEPGPPDTGAVEWHGPDLVERGVTCVHGEPVTYEEVWRREPGRRAPVVVLTSDGADGECRGMLVRVGDDAIVMATTGHGLAARRERRAGEAWRTVGSLGAAAALPAIPEPRPGWEAGAEVSLAPVPGSGADAVAVGWRVRELER